MSLNHFTGRLCDLVERKQNNSLTVCPSGSSHSLCFGAWCSSALTTHCSSPHTQRSLRSTHLIVLLFCLKPQGFSQDKEQGFCPGSKPWGLVPNVLHSHMLRCTLLPHAHPSDRLIAVATGPLHVLFFLECSSLPTFCLIIPIHHSALTFTSLCREPDLQYHSGPLIISLLGTMSFFMTSLSTAIILLHWFCDYLSNLCLP